MERCNLLERRDVNLITASQRHPLNPKRLSQAPSSAPLVIVCHKSPSSSSSKRYKNVSHSHLIGIDRTRWHTPHGRNNYGDFEWSTKQFAGTARKGEFKQAIGQLLQRPTNILQCAFGKVRLDLCKILLVIHLRVL